MTHLIHSTGGHLVYKPANGHIVHAKASAPSSCPWPDGGLVAAYFVNIPPCAPATPNGYTVYIEDSGYGCGGGPGCVWTYDYNGDGAISHIVISLESDPVPFWKMVVHAKDTYAGGGASFLCFTAEKLTGLTPSGVYTITYSVDGGPASVSVG